MKMETSTLELEGEVQCIHECRSRVSLRELHDFYTGEILTNVDGYTVIYHTCALFANGEEINLEQVYLNIPAFLVEREDKRHFLPFDTYDIHAKISLVNMKRGLGKIGGMMPCDFALDDESHTAYISYKVETVDADSIMVYGGKELIKAAKHKKLPCLAIGTGGNYEFYAVPIAMSVAASMSDVSANDLRATLDRALHAREDELWHGKH